MNVLVSGGAGYIGSVVAAELQKAGHRVTVCDNLMHGHRQAVARGMELVVGDMADTEKLKSVMTERGIEAVMHFAALIEAGESMQIPERYFRINNANSLSLLEAMLAARVKRFVFSSTAAVYGEPDRVPIAEDQPLRPTNPYGESKLLVERMLEWFHRIHGLSYASLRYFNAAGATAERGEAHDPETHLIPLVLQVALGRRPHISIYGNDYPTPDGTGVRDYIHVLDLAKAHLLALDALATRPRQIYNLGNGNGFSVRQVIETARHITGHHIPEVITPRRPGDTAVLVASSAKIRADLGWKPEYPDLKTIVRTAWEWHRSHPHGFGSDADRK